MRGLHTRSTTTEARAGSATGPTGWPGWTRFVGLALSILGVALVIAALSASSLYAQVVPGGLIALPETPPRPLGSLKSVALPTPPQLADYIQDQQAAVQLGKAFFWDVQVGSDGITACASCHYQAGADGRARNQVNPGHDGIFTTQRPNGNLADADFPLHKLADPTGATTQAVSDSDDVIGSQGVMQRVFDGTPAKGTLAPAADVCTTVQDSIFNIGGLDVRRVTGRNAPTAINAIFNFRNFWDGRAQNTFNGQNPFGDRDPDARVYKVVDGQVQPVRVALQNASLASQATGPGLSGVEMSCDGRMWPHVGHKLMDLVPLGLQRVDPADSTLGALARSRQTPRATGLTVSYADLIKRTFRPEFWSATVPLDGAQVPQLEANFALFWGLAVQAYEATLVSDDTRFDRYMEGDRAALSQQEQTGLSIFEGKGNCVGCHGGPEFTNASVANVTSQRLERMLIGDGRCGIYDNGFYNIGVRPTAEDPGIGASDPFGNPLSEAVLAIRGAFSDPTLMPSLGSLPECDARVATAGAFKVPTLRNVELTGPYFHNGGQATLRQVVDFYSRGGDFAEMNRPNLDGEFSAVHLAEDEKDALVAFLRSLTDERVRRQSAPFDHPSLCITNGQVGSTTTVKQGVAAGLAADQMICLPEVGAAGSPTPLRAFPGPDVNGGPFVNPALPTASISYAGPAGESGVYRGDVTATLSAADDGGPGLWSLSYTLDGGPSTSIVTGATVNISGEGAHVLQVIATDLAGISAAPLVQAITIDTTPPVATLTPSGTASAGVYRTPVLVTALASDSEGGSGIGALTYTLDNSGPTAITSGETITVNADGRHTLVLQVTDRAGNTAEARQTFVVDSHPPVVSVALAGPQGVSGHFRGSVLATVSASDAPGGLGVASVQYTLDGGTPTPIASGETVLVSTVGNHTLSVEGRDLAGNTGAPTKYTFAISTEAPNPVVSLGGSHGVGSNYRGPVTATITTSGGGAAPLVALVATIDDGAPTAVAAGGQLTISVPGKHTLRVGSIDAAGNTATTSAAFDIDSTPPSASVTLSGTSRGGSIYRGPVTARVVANDDGTAGLAGAQYVLDNGQPVGVPADGIVSIASEGVHNLVVTATDRAGNSSRPANETFTIDNTAPVPSLELAGQRGASGAYRSVVATMGASDAAGLGLASLVYSLDRAPAVNTALGSTLKVSTSGNHTLELTATDQAGNTTSTRRVFRVDPTPPVVSIAFSGAAGDRNATFLASAVATISASDGADGSGIANLVYRLDAGGPTGIGTGGTLSIRQLGTHTLSVTATDGAGNASTVSRVISIQPAPRPAPVRVAQPAAIATPVARQSRTAVSVITPTALPAARQVASVPVSASVPTPGRNPEVVPAGRPELAAQYAPGAPALPVSSEAAASEGAAASPLVATTEEAQQAQPQSAPLLTIIDPASGGVVGTPDGRLQVEIPADAWYEPLLVGVEAAAPEGGNLLVNGVAYTLIVRDSLDTDLLGHVPGLRLRYVPTEDDLAVAGGDLSGLTLVAIQPDGSASPLDTTTAADGLSFEAVLHDEDAAQPAEADTSILAASEADLEIADASVAEYEAPE